MDYLPNPLQRRASWRQENASLAGKRLRDLELEYLEQVGVVTDAAAALQAAAFEGASIDYVAERTDALGQLARVLQKNADEIAAREIRMQRQMLALRIEIDEVRRPKKVGREPLAPGRFLCSLIQNSMVSLALSIAR